MLAIRPPLPPVKMPVPADTYPKAPHALLLMLEGRAPWEWAAAVAAFPWLDKLPAGDGPPVFGPRLAVLERWWSFEASGRLLRWLFKTPSALAG